mmetsp:Transcript_3992/g.7687  ORF Transcript_3992/g.7687 Transcript_3992/m.7687 type:complete len:336 (+) Transcript_3992:316-1323(+)
MKASEQTKVVGDLMAMLPGKASPTEKLPPLFEEDYERHDWDFFTTLDQDPESGECVTEETNTDCTSETVTQEESKEAEPQIEHNEKKAEQTKGLGGQESLLQLHMENLYVSPITSSTTQTSPSSEYASTVSCSSGTSSTTLSSSGSVFQRSPTESASSLLENRLGSVPHETTQYQRSPLVESFDDSKEDHKVQLWQEKKHEFISLDTPSGQAPCEPLEPDSGSNVFAAECLAKAQVFMIKFITNALHLSQEGKLLNGLCFIGIVGGSFVMGSSNSGSNASRAYTASSIKSISLLLSLANFAGHAFYRQMLPKNGRASHEDLDLTDVNEESVLASK